MRFDTIPFLLFFLVLCAIYYSISGKFKHVILVIASYIFYMAYDVKAAALLFIVTLLNYLLGRKLAKKKSKISLGIGVVANIFVLFIFKYLNFFSELFNINNTFDIASYVMPIGLSFYILENIGYIIDVYRNASKYQKNFLKYSLFISFFPKIICGPIEDSKKFMNQVEINKNRKFSYKKFQNGFWLVAFGLFMKLFLSERLAIIVNSVYDNVALFENGGGAYYILATVLYAFQIYYDFKGYSYLARGLAKMLGYNLTVNFAKPYFAICIRDFWRRWHMSLTGFFRRYLYISLGGNKKGKLRKALNTLIVFLVSGLWHGASINYIIWGALHGIYMVFEDLFSTKKELRVKNGLIKGLVTFAAVDFAWIFFRAYTVTDAITVIKNLLEFGMKFELAKLSVTNLDVLILLIGFSMTLFIEWLSRRNFSVKFFLKRNALIKATACYLILFTTIIFGVYGVGYNAQEFIYLGF